ncbi:MAG: SIR2 family protein, partial [Candidatus Auribacterota bacterium]
NISIPFHRILNDEQLSTFSGMQKPPFIKAHGEIGYKPLVTLEDLHMCEVRNPLLFQYIKSLFTTHTIFFIGYSMSDSNFLDYFYRFTPPNRMHFMLTFKKKLKFENWKNCLLDNELLTIKLDFEQIAKKFKNEDTDKAYKSAYFNFLTKLKEDVDAHTRKSHATSEERAHKISEWLEEWQKKTVTLRIRAGLSPVAFPEINEKKIANKSVLYAILRKNDKTKENASKEATEKILCPWKKEESDAQERLSTTFKSTINRAKEVKLILSTDFESLQQRDINSKWAACRLKALIEYFENGDGCKETIHIVDRNGPYEIQQYILNENEKIESQKRLGEKEAYHEVYFIDNMQRLIKKDIEIFDSCFFTFQMENLLELLAVQGKGLKSLVDTLETSKINLFVEEADIDISLKNIIGDGSKKNKEEEVKKIQKTLEAFKKRILDIKMNGKEGCVYDRLNFEIINQPAHILLIVLNKSLLSSAIKVHLIEKWTNLFEQLIGDRSHDLRLALRDARDKICGSVPKASFHLNLPPFSEGLDKIKGIDISGEIEKSLLNKENFDEKGYLDDLNLSYPLWNTHISGFAITGDRKNLVFRRCLTQHMTKLQHSHPHLEPGYWDRTISGHVLRGSNAFKELSDEITHHFKGVKNMGALDDDGNLSFELLCSKTEFKNTFKGDARDKIVVRHFSCKPLQMIIPKKRWHIKNEDSEYIQEPIFSMPFIILLPPEITKSRDLPKINKKNNHSAGWLFLNKINVKNLIASLTRNYEERIFIDTEEIDMSKDIVLFSKDDLGTKLELTWECVLFLKYFGEEIVEYLV